MGRIPVIVPVVASYPDWAGIKYNALQCQKRSDVAVFLDPALYRKPKRINHDKPYGDPKKRAERLFSMLFQNCNKNELGIIATATGGVGTVRTLAQLDDRDLSSFKNKVAVGFSDTTALALLVTTCSQYPSFHGPCFEDDEFEAALPYYLQERRDWSVTPTFKDRVPNETIEGTLWGGNLTLFGHMLSHPNVRNAVNTSPDVALFFEDIYEKRLYGTAKKRDLLEMEFDRLEMAGVFETTRAIIMGRVTGISRRKVLESLRLYYKGPVVGIDVGHKEGKKGFALMPPMPLGTRVSLSPEKRSLVCTWQESKLGS